MISVTTILDTFPEKELVEWQLRVGAAKAKQIGDEAKHIGTVVDAQVQSCFKEIPIDLYASLTPTEQSAVASCVLGWSKFKKEHPEFIPSVVGVQDELIHGDVIGHPDFICKRKEGWGIVDLKCANQIRPTYWTQVAAYSWLKSQMDNVTFLGILRLNKLNGGYEYVELVDPDQIDYEVQVWLNYKVLYEHRQRVADRSRLMREEETLNVP